MKVLVVTNLYPPTVLGGYEILCEAVVGSFMGRGHQVVVQTSSNPTAGAKYAGETRGRFQEAIQYNLKLFIPFDLPARKARLRHLITALHNERQTARLIAHSTPDIVFFWSQRRLSLGSVAAACKSSVPYAMTLNDTFLLAYRPVTFIFSPRRAVGCLLEMTLFSRTTYRGLQLPAVTTISEALLDAHLQAGTPLQHARLIRQGVDLEQFSLKEQPGCLHQPPRLLYVGQLHDYKGVHVVVEALALLKRRGFQHSLDIIGTGDRGYEELLRAQALELGISERVRFHGRVPQAELPAQYRQHDVLIFPSLWDEPFGLTHLEAMACGTPVIATNRGGVGEFLRDGYNALTVDAGNVQQLAEKIVFLTENSEQRQAIAYAARRQVEDDFSLDRYSKDLEAFLIHTIAHWPELKRAARRF